MAKDKDKGREVKYLLGTKVKETETKDVAPKAKEAKTKPKEADSKAADPPLGSKEDPPPKAKS